MPLSTPCTLFSAVASFFASFRRPLDDNDRRFVYQFSCSALCLRSGAFGPAHEYDEDNRREIGLTLSFNLLVFCNIVSNYIALTHIFSLRSSAAAVWLRRMCGTYENIGRIIITSSMISRAAKMCACGAAERLGNNPIAARR